MTAAYAVRGELLLGTQLVPGAVVIAGGRIAAIHRDPATLPDGLPVREAGIVAPGFVDLQVNGGYGVEVGPDADALRFLAARLPQTGVTAWLPTVISSPAACYPGVLAALAAAQNAPGAAMLGLHAEGPFLAVARAGAHPPAVIGAADWGLLDTLLAPGLVRLVTLAPERPGAIEAMRRLVAAGIVVALGHTDATAAQYAAGVDAGATMATHLYNAMSPFAHRAPGAVGVALTDDRLAVGLIADGVHAHPLAVRLAVRAKGAERIALVTDMMAAAGMPPGSYPLGGRSVIADSVAARLPNGTLAGAILTMEAAVRNVVQFAGASLGEALAMASSVPSRLLGLPDRGCLAVGTRADLALLTPDLHMQATIIGGKCVYDAVGSRQ